jgi:hypothetical protein
MPILAPGDEIVRPFDVTAHPIQVFDEEAAVVLDRLYAHLYLLTDVSMHVDPTSELIVFFQEHYGLTIESHHDRVLIRTLISECLSLISTLPALLDLEASGDDVQAAGELVADVPDARELVRTRHAASVTQNTQDARLRAAERALDSPPVQRRRGRDRRRR